MTDDDDLFAPSNKRVGKNGKSAGDIARDKAIARVMKNAKKEWKKEFDTKLPRVSGYVGTFEAIRNHMSATVGLSESPHHSNAWGGISNGLVIKGLLIPTGDRRKMENERSHSRKTPVYRVK